MKGIHGKEKSQFFLPEHSYEKYLARGKKASCRQMVKKFGRISGGNLKMTNELL
jgi:hypothetical protein